MPYLFRFDIISVHIGQVKKSRFISHPQSGSLVALQSSGLKNGCSVSFPSRFLEDKPCKANL